MVGRSTLCTRRTIQLVKQPAFQHVGGRNKGKIAWEGLKLEQLGLTNRNTCLKSLGLAAYWYMHMLSIGQNVESEKEHQKYITKISLYGYPSY